jgi:nitroreductase
MKDSIFFRRESKRSYLDKEIPQDILDQLFEIVRWSPSNSNNQPWRFIFVREKEQHAKVMEGMSRGNQWMARAPIIVVLCARQEDDFVRQDDPVKYYQFDCGLACMSLLLGAVDLGLMAHPTAGWSAPPIKEALGIPGEYHVLCVIGLGYKGPIEQLSGRAREYDESPRARKPLNEVITMDRFDF